MMFCIFTYNNTFNDLHKIKFFFFKGLFFTGYLTFFDSVSTKFMMFFVWELRIHSLQQCEKKLFIYEGINLYFFETENCNRQSCPQTQVTHFIYLIINSILLVYINSYLINDISESFFLFRQIYVRWNVCTILLKLGFYLIY